MTNLNNDVKFKIPFATYPHVHRKKQLEIDTLIKNIFEVFGDADNDEMIEAFKEYEIDPESLRTEKGMSALNNKQIERLKLLYEELKNIQETEDLVSDISEILSSADNDDITEAFQKCGINFADMKIRECVTVLSNNFLIVEIRLLHRDLFIYMFAIGSLPSDFSYYNVKECLGINYCADILDKDLKDENLVETFCNRYENFFQIKEDANTDYEKLEKVIHENGREINCSANLFDILYNLFDFSESEIEPYRQYFIDLDLQTRLRWIMFLLCAHKLVEENVGLTEKADQWPKCITEDKIVLSFLQLLKKQLNILIEESEKQKNEIKVCRAYNSNLCGSPNSSYLSQILNFPFLNFAPTYKAWPVIQVPKGMPEAMLNGGNTCYISSTVWPLFTLLFNEITQKIDEQERNLKELGECKDEFFLRQKNALITFKKLFSELASGSQKPLSAHTVNQFRVAVHQFSPTSFFQPGKSSQEDAYEFLICLLTDLLKLDSCGKEAPKFSVLHKFEQLDKEKEIPAIYDLEAGLLPCQTNEATPIIEIRLPDLIQNPEPKKLSSLLTEVRQAPNMNREIDLKEGVDNSDKKNPLHYYFPASHTEQFVLSSKEAAPLYFIGRLTRFSRDEFHIEQKRNDSIELEATIEFPIVGKEGETVAFDLYGITIHDGTSTHAGHYYSYLRVKEGNDQVFFEYNDQSGRRRVTDQEVVQDATFNAYIVYYKKRGEGELPPQALPSPRSHEEIAQQTSDRKRHLPTPTDSNDSGERVQKRQEKESDFSFSQTEVSVWVNENKLNKFKIGTKVCVTVQDLLCDVADSSHTKNLNAIALKGDSALFKESAKLLKRSIYIINPNKDRDLWVAEDFPIPGDKFRYGDEFSENPILYVYCDKKQNYCVLNLR